MVVDNAMRKELTSPLLIDDARERAPNALS